MTPPTARRTAAIAGLSALGLLGCQATAVAPTPTASVVPSPFPSPTPAPWLLLGSEAAGQVRAAVEGIALQSGLSVRVEDLSDPGEVPPGGLAALVGTQAELEPILKSWPLSSMSVVVLQATDLQASGRVSVVDFDWRHDQEGFLAGAGAGLATAFGAVGLVPGDGSAAAEEFGAGFAEGVRYTCPRCRLEVVQDLARPPFGVDVVGLPPGAPLPGAPPAENAVWIVAAASVESGPWRRRQAAELEVDLEVVVAAALEALLAGGDGRAWVPAVENGGLRMGAVDPAAISPGRERLLREAEARLAGGLLTLGGGD